MCVFSHQMAINLMLFAIVTLSDCAARDVNKFNLWKFNNNKNS